MTVLPYCTGDIQTMVNEVRLKEGLVKRTETMKEGV